MRYLLLSALILPLCAHDWLIVPGERVGPVSAKSTEADLRTAFAGGSVVRSAIQIDRATSAPGLLVYGGKANESLAVVWPRKDGELWWPLTVIPCYGLAAGECRWGTVSGVHIGSTVAEIEKINTKPFLLSPSASLRAWIEPRWQDGRLAQELGEDVELYFDGPGDPFYAGGEYVSTGAEPLHGGVRRVNRMLVFLLSGGRPAPRNDWIAGGHFWSVVTTAAVEPLRETLGAAVVHRTIEDGEEGIGKLPGVAIFAGQANAQVRRWLNEDGVIFTCGGQDGCRWRLPGGLPWKMTLAEAVKLNGRHFVFNGFNFDLSGIITSWEGGQMDARMGRARLTVDCQGQDYPQRMMGEVQLRSDDPEFRRLHCTVSVLSF